SGLLWIGSESLGLSKVDPLGATFHYIVDQDRSRNVGSTNNIRAILEDARGTLWLGTDGDGLKSYDRESGKFSYFDESMAQAFRLAPSSRVEIEALAEDAEGNIWFIGNPGVGILDPVTLLITILPREVLAE